MLIGDLRHLALALRHLLFGGAQATAGRPQLQLLTGKKTVCGTPCRGLNHTQVWLRVHNCMCWSAICVLQKGTLFLVFGRDMCARCPVPHSNCCLAAGCRACACAVGKCTPVVGALLHR